MEMTFEKDNTTFDLGDGKPTKVPRSYIERRKLILTKQVQKIQAELDSLSVCVVEMDKIKATSTDIGEIIK